MVCRKVANLPSLGLKFDCIIPLKITVPHSDKRPVIKILLATCAGIASLSALVSSPLRIQTADPSKGFFMAP
jgi:hypothetical protein